MKNRLLLLQKYSKIILLFIFILILIYFIYTLIKRNFVKEVEYVEYEFQENQDIELNNYLPYETDKFIINYPEYNIYYINLKLEDIKGTKDEVYNWIKSKGVDPKSLNLKFITISEESNIEKINDLLPIENKFFGIYFSAKKDQYLISIFTESFTDGYNKVVEWFKEQGIKDIGILNIIWQNKMLPSGIENDNENNENNLTEPFEDGNPGM